MDGESRDHLLRSAWELDRSEDRVPALSEISRADRPGSPPPVAAAGRIALHVEEPRRRGPPCLLGAAAVGRRRCRERSSFSRRPEPCGVLARRIAGGLRPRLRNQRQDDHRVDDRRDSAHRRPRRRPQSRRIQHALGCGDRDVGTAGRDRRLRGRRGVVADPGDGARPPCDRARESLPGSTRRLRRARRPGDGLEDDARRRSRGRRSCSTRTTPWSQAWGRPAPREAGGRPSSSASRIALRTGRETEHTADSIRCPVCDEPLLFDARLLSHLGHYRCDACGARRPRPCNRGG